MDTQDNSANRSFTCEWAIEDLKPLVEHSRNAPEHQAPYGIGKPEPGLFFVHDFGVYLMSNGIPPLLSEGNWDEYQKAAAAWKEDHSLPVPSIHHKVVYAKGLEPQMPDDEFIARAGGDDFGELVPLEAIEQAIEDGDTHFCIDINRVTVRYFSFKRKA